MRSLFAFVTTIALALGASVAHAAEPRASCPVNADGVPECPKPEVELDVRTGVSLPTGSAVAGSQMTDIVAAQVPIQIDLGLRPDPHLFLGAYGSYGFLFPASSACQGASCSGDDVRLGIEAQYHFRPAMRFDPWVGVGAGYEWLHFASLQNGADETTKLQNFELLNVQAGLDYAVCTGLRLGPFASFALEQYEHETLTWTGGQAGAGATSDASPQSAQGTVLHEQAQDVPQTALHEWLTLGVRGSFDL
jgi:hypothetical protein